MVMEFSFTLSLNKPRRSLFVVSNYSVFSFSKSSIPSKSASSTSTIPHSAVSNINNRRLQVSRQISASISTGFSMAAFSRREGVLLSFNNPISAKRSPDIDFRDVFGGPPRRASIQETRFGSDAFEFGGEDETILHRRHRWSGLSERPVFGEEGVNRRRNGRDGFFDDIFGGSDSSSSSPRDPLNSNPSSRILSPGRPISSRFSEPLTSSSQPSQLSVPRKSINQHKNKDGRSNGLSSHSPLSRFSSQVQEESRNSSSSKSSLSRETSPISGESEILEQPEEAKKDKNLKKDSTDSRVQSAGHQFHFSIYRWASKRMPLPCRGGRELKMIEPFKLEKSSSPSGRIVCEGMPKESPAGTENQLDSDTVSSDANSCEIELANSKSSSNVSEDISEPVEDEISPVNSNIQDLKAENGQISASIKEVTRSYSKTLRTLFSGNNGAKEPEQNVVKSTRKSSAAGEKQSKQDVKRMLLNNEETGKADTQGTHISSQDKIKEFLKIYDQETSGPSELKETSQSRSFRWKDIVKIRTSNDRILPTANLYEDLPRTAATEKVDALPKEPEKRRSLDSKGSSASTAGSNLIGSEARDEHVGNSFHLNIQITELAQDEDELQQAGNIQDEIREIDANIIKWSQGRQGNIRSLLSTLQFVLWPESGWKPVPLVDIIESNAVKKSYQKALLSLHPDKLQQKGATSNQKYIAEKVFDILQEAWTHFNTLGSV